MYNVSIVVSMTTNNVINGGLLPPASSRVVSRFKEVSQFKTVLMGRRTFNELGPLAQRINLVLSRQNLGLKEVLEIDSVEAALNFSKTQEILVLGGEEVYNQLLPYASKIYLTLIDKEVKGNQFLMIKEEDWEVAHEEIVDSITKLRTLIRRDKKIEF